MNDKNSNDPVDRLVGAYETMLERVHEAADTAERKTVPWLRETLANAREKAVQLGELSREEADRISSYVERDIHDAASFIADSGQEFRDWLAFDMSLIQDRFLEMMAGMADQTSRALSEIAERARQASVYRTGEIASPGTLECAACGELLHFEKTGHIPPCPKCKGTTFRRVQHPQEGAH
jgi:predicted RNA-binding Zn-ribbon protein involved in translation (DUF1610 family)